MTAALKEWLGPEPATYAQKVIKACGLLEPPFCERQIAEFLKIDIFECSVTNLEAFAALNLDIPSPEKLAQEAGTFLMMGPDGNKIIFTPAEAPITRKRMNIFHECGHAILPWHTGLCYLCKDKDLDPGVRKQIEREAFLCASEFLMPRAYFIQDVLNLQSMSVASIQLLSKRYHASLEATANWYAHIHPGICSVLMVEPTNLLEPEYSEIEVIPEHQERLKVGAPPNFYKREEPEGVPLKVKYSMRSRRFPEYIRSNTGIAKDSPLYQAWRKKAVVRGEIPAVTFGFLNKAPLQFECLPLGYHDRMLVLLWEEDRQNRLIYAGKELVV
jgi:hypothetical protein